MFYAGIGCSERGYRLTVLDSSGSDYSTVDVRPGPAALDSVIETLRQGVDPGDGQLRCFVDSATGALAGLLTEAGLEIYRLDLPFVTIPADTRLLAQAGRTASGRSTRLDPESGFLRGRVDELVALWASCADLEAELARAGRFLAHGDRNHREVALTFDDGPHPPYTNGVLDILGDFGVPATFFCLGLAVAAYPEVVLRAQSEGHCIANHTWSHPYLPDLSDEQLEFQVRAAEAALRDATGQSPILFRPPYGSRTPYIERRLVTLRQIVVTWDVDAQDWSRPGTRSIVDRVLADVRDGSVILLHDGGGDRSQTVAALPSIIEGLLEHEYRLVTVEGLLSSAPRPGESS
jgi:peptidoglycan-N-acetylglucosamine deacetylase